MANGPVAVASRRRRRWLAGIPFIAIAAILGLMELFAPRWISQLSVPGRVMFRGLIVLFGMAGLVQFAASRSPTRGTIATPGFGRHRMVVPVEGLVYLTIMFALFTGAMLTRSNMLLLVFALMAGPFVINGWLTFGMLQAARVGRRAPPRAMAGELFSVELELTNSRRLFSIWIMSVRDTLVHKAEELTATVLFARVAPRTTQMGHYQLRLLRRGRFRLGPLLTFSRFPLGLVERSRQFPAPGEILIYPQIGRLSPQWRRRWLGGSELVARPRAHAGMFHDEFHRLREFRTGDNPRDIHWRTSARRGELILREYQQNRDFHLTVVVDLWRPAAPSAQETLRVEHCLSLLATLIVDYGRSCRDALLTVSIGGATVFQWQGQGTTASLESLLDGLALIEASPRTKAGELVDEALQRANGSTQLVVLTTRPADAADGTGLDRVRGRADLIRLTDIDITQVLVLESPESTLAGEPDPTKTSAAAAVDR